MDSREQISQVVVNAQQMRDIEGRVFAAGMPVAALMERWEADCPSDSSALSLFADATSRDFGGACHNGGDALVVARELHSRAMRLLVYCPSKLKELTSQHAQYAESVGILSFLVVTLQECDLLVDGLFGFGLRRSLTQLLLLLTS